MTGFFTSTSPALVVPLKPRIVHISSSDPGTERPTARFTEIAQLIKSLKRVLRPKFESGRPSSGMLTSDQTLQLSEKETYLLKSLDKSRAPILSSSSGADTHMKIASMVLESMPWNMQPHDCTSRNYVVIERNRPCFYHSHEGRIIITTSYRRMGYSSSKAHQYSVPACT
jgi:hypothetical protein